MIQKARDEDVAARDKSWGKVEDPLDGLLCSLVLGLMLRP